MIAFRWGLAIMPVLILHGIGSSAGLAQVVPSSIAQAMQEQPVQEENSPDTIPLTDPPRSPLQPAQTQTLPAPAPATETAPVSQEALPSCPAGQFASAFPDVTPDDWAYDAVNRLAGVPIRCFPLSPQS